MTMDTTALSHQMFDQLFRQNKRQLFIVAFSYVRDEDVAQDIVNDSFMSIWERRESIEPTDLKAYLSVLLEIIAFIIAGTNKSGERSVKRSVKKKPV